MLLLLTFTACSQVQDLLPGIGSLELIKGTATFYVPQRGSATATFSPTPAGPTATPSPSLTPTSTFTPQPTRTPRPTETPSATAPPVVRVGPDNFPDYINPLTGLVPMNPLLLERRPITVKVPNYPHYVYPQSGLSKADQIFEYHLEQGLTRFAAIFYGNDTLRVGPIRSGRTFDAHIVQMYNSSYVFNYAYREEGNQPLDVLGYLESVLDERLFVNDPGSCTSWMCRDESIESYNNLFANTYNISELITQRGVDNVRQDLATNLFTTLGGRSQESITTINVNYSYANYAYWQYEKDKNRYYRYQGNVDLDGMVEPEYILLTDANDNQPIAADNVVVLYVPHIFLYKSGISEVFDIQLVDRGKAWIFRNGGAFEAIWERREVNKPLYLLTPQGAPFPLHPGVTFFQVLSTESEFFIQGEEEWTFKFIRPPEPAE
jgi:hypothetical protein